MLQNRKLIPGLSKWTELTAPDSYNPRSKRFPSKREKTLWKKGSWLGKSTVEPAGTTSRWGSKVLFFWTTWGRCFAEATAFVVEKSSGFSQITMFDRSLVFRDVDTASEPRAPSCTRNVAVFLSSSAAAKQDNASRPASQILREAIDKMRMNTLENIS